MEVRSYNEKEHLIQQGEEASEFLVILQGTASVQVDGNEVRTFQRLDFMGEAALVNENHIRGATVTATKLVHALVLSRNKYEKLMEEGAILQKTHARARRMSMEYSAQDAARMLMQETDHVTVQGEEEDGEVEEYELSISDMEEMENEEDD